MNRFLLLSTMLLCASVTPPMLGEQLPEIRPALLGNGPKSLVNLIDTKKLMEKGQKDARLQFSLGVGEYGFGGGVVTYGATPGSDLLAREVIEKAPRALFIPPVFRHEKAFAYVDGTVIFGIIDGKPHLRIFLHQDPAHMKTGDDFIAPQEIYSYKLDRFTGAQYRDPVPGIPGHVALKLNIDATGKIVDWKMVYENPPNKSFGEAVTSRIKDINFLPAYSHGHPVASTTTAQFLFRGGSSSRWQSN